ncbi:MAG TPA: hypothetical protein VNJ01_15505 [Bacteriovoracaceae bacterium]|nr:hypothetical protein [Bacteriovoracaceae bacterium]
MMNLILTLLLLAAVGSCSHLSNKSTSNSNYESDTESQGEIVDLEKILNRAEESARPQGKTILATGRSMIKKNQIFRGSCWDFANAVYNKAGYPQNQRRTPLKSNIKGPYADLSTLEPGDWLYFINYSFRENDHSGIFIEWTDYEKNKAVVLSYVGGRKKQPGNYKIYDLKHVYNIIRPKSVN